MRLYCFLLFIFCVISNSLYAQVVNIESHRMHVDSVRFVLDNDFSFSYVDNDGKYIFELSDNLTTQLKSKDLRKIYFLLGNFGLIRAEDEDFANNWLIHFRFNYKVTRLFRLESFVQSQSNELLDLSGRRLIGAGVRLKLVSTANVGLYFGNSYMYEIEIGDELNQKFYNHRNNSYLSFSILLPKSEINIINTVYYQPLYNDISNYNISEQFKIVVPFSKKVNVFSLFKYYYDSITPGNRSQYTSNLFLGIGLNI